MLEFGGDAMVVLFTGELHATARSDRRGTHVPLHEATKVASSTPAGDARLRMSCGMASGTQAYHLLGSTRRALVVAGPVSTAMAELEAAADAGEARIDEPLAAALPASWVDRSESDCCGSDSGGSPIDEASTEPLDPHVRRPRGSRQLLPTQFHSLIDAHHRAGELKQVAMSFIRLNGTDDMLATLGIAALHDRLSEITDIVDRAAAELDVCWLETQAEANSVRWTLIAGAPTATERDGERLLRVLRKIAEHTPLPLRIGANLGVVFVGDMGHPQRCTFIVMGDATNLAARLMAQRRSRRDHRRRAPLRHLRRAIREHSVGAVPGQGQTRAQSAPFSSAKSPTTTSPPRPPLELTTTMVGRQAELDRLLEVVRPEGSSDLVGELALERRGCGSRPE